MSKAGITQTGGREATEGLIEGEVALSVGMPHSQPPSGWTWRKLTDLARLESGHTPSRQKPEYWDGDIPWIGIRDATANHGRTLADTNQHVTQAGIDNSSARVLPANTVCLSRTASVGYVVVMGREMATSQDFVNWVCNDSKLDYRFLKYVLLAENRSFSRFSHGTTHQTIYFPEVKAFHICVPAIEEQRSIADALGSLDDKIEQNRQTGRKLEALARAVFKAWFVDFEPVKAKAAGATAFPGMPAETFATLPTRLVDSALGPVPEGWEVGMLGDLCNLKRGYDLPSAKRISGKIPIVSSSGISGTHNRAKVSGPGVITGRYGTIGQVHFVNSEYWPLNTTLYVEDFKGLSPRFVFHVLSGVDFLKYVDKAAVPGVNRNHLHLEPLVIPPAALQAQFAQFVQPLWAAVDHAEVESAKLATLRDYLLPRLLSGRVGKAQAHAGEVG